MVGTGVAAGVILLGVGAAAIVFKDRIQEALGQEPIDVPPGMVPPEEMPPIGNGEPPRLCEPQNNFEEVCIAATQQAQDDFNRFMMYKVFMQNITDREITFDLIDQFKNEDGTVQDLQARRQTIGAGKRSEFTFNFIWITGGLKEIDFFAWKSIDNPTPISLKAALNTLVKISG